MRIRHKVGELLVRQGAKPEALKELRAVADSYAKSGFYLKAVAVYKQMVKLKPDFYEVHLKLGEYYQQLSLMSESMEHYSVVAAFYEENGTARECLDVYKKIVDLSQDDIHSKLKLAEYHAREDETEEAITLYKDVAQSLREKDRLDELIRVYERLLQLAPDSLELYKQLAALYLEANDARRALTKLQICFKSDPGDTETLSLLGETFMALNQVAKAKSVYKELARIHVYQGHPEKQQELFERIHRIDPSDPDAREALGLDVRVKSEIVSEPQAGDVIPPAANGGATAGEQTDSSRSSRTAAASGGATTFSKESREQADPLQRVDGHSSQLHRIPASVAKLMTELDVYLKYNLAEKAQSHLRVILEREPDCYLPRDKYRDLLIQLGREKEAAKQSLTMSQLAAAVGENLQARLDLERAVQLDESEDEYRHALEALSRSMTRFAGPQTIAPPDFKATSAEHVMIEEEDDESLVGAYPLGESSEIEILDEADLVDDIDAQQSVYLTLTGVALDLIEPIGEDGGPVDPHVTTNLKAELDSAIPQGDSEGSGACEQAGEAGVDPPDHGESIFELDELIDDEDGGLDLVEELELELGMDLVPDKVLTEKLDSAGQAGELAQAYFKMRLYDDALKELEVARGRESLNFELQFLSARCHFGLGNIAETVRWFQRILNRTDLSETQELEALFHLGQAYEAQGEPGLAIDLYEEITSINKEFRQTEVQERIATLNSCQVQPEKSGAA